MSLLTSLLAPPLITLLLVPMQQADVQPYRLLEISSAGYLLRAGAPIYSLNASGARWALVHDDLNATVQVEGRSLCIRAQEVPSPAGHSNLRIRLPYPLQLPLMLRATINATPGAFVHVRGLGLDAQRRILQLWDEEGPLDDLQPSSTPTEFWGAVPSHRILYPANMTEFEFILDLLRPSPAPSSACLLQLTLSPLHLLRLSGGAVSLTPDDVALLFPSSPSPIGLRPAMLRSVLTLNADPASAVTPLYIASNESAYQGEGIAGGLLPYRIGYDLLLTGPGEPAGRTPGHLYSAFLGPPGAMLRLSLAAPARLELAKLELVYTSAPEGKSVPWYIPYLYIAYALIAPLAFMALALRRPEAMRPPLIASLGLGLRLGLAPFTGHPLDSLLFSLSARNYLLEGTAVQGAVFPVPVYLDLLPLYAYLGTGARALDFYFAYHTSGALELLLLKAPFMLSDLAAFALLAACLGRLKGEQGAWGLASLYYLNPLALTVSSAWLQYDGLSCALLLAALLLVLQGRSWPVLLAAFSLAALSGPFGLLGLALFCALAVRQRSMPIAPLAGLLGALLLVFGPNLAGPLLFWSGLSARLPSRHPFSLLGVLQAELRFSLPAWYPLVLVVGGLALLSFLVRRRATRGFAGLLVLLFSALLFYYMAYFYVFEQHYLWALSLLPLMGALARRKSIFPLMVALGAVVALGANPMQLITGAGAPLAGAYSELAGLLVRALASLLLLACGGLVARPSKPSVPSS
jgi:hypothetical protein